MDKKTPDNESQKPNSREEKLELSLEESVNQEAERADVEKNDLNFMADSKEAMLIRKTPYANAVLYVVAGIILTFIIWASFASVDELVKTRCKAVTAKQMQIVRNEVGGTLSAILVHEGQKVSVGTPLAKITDTTYVADVNRLKKKTTSLEANVARLKAQSKIHAKDLDEGFTAKDLIVPDINYTAQFRKDNPEMTNKMEAEYNRTVDALVKRLTRDLDILREKEQRYENVKKSDLYSETSYSDMRQEIIDRKNKINDDINEVVTRAESTLLTEERELKNAREELNKANYYLKRTEVVSTVNGIVNQVKFKSIGSAVDTRTELMEIAPEGDLVFECELPPKDKSFVKVGDDVILKLDSLDFSIYGSLHGKITRINPGLSTSPEDERVKFYETEVKPDQNYLMANGKKEEIKLHMLGEGNIITGKKTIMSYLMKPFTKARHNALTER